MATITGNPQNMVIGALFAAFPIPPSRRLSRLSRPSVSSRPSSSSGLVYRKEFAFKGDLEPHLIRGRMHGGQAAKASLVCVALAVAFFAGVEPAKAAVLGGAFLLVTRSIKPERIYHEVDGPLLMMFAGLFVVVAGAERAALTPDRIAMAKSVGLDIPWRLSGFTAVLSNIVSNVPAVLALKPFVPTFGDPRKAWLIVAMSSTLAGNFTLLGSVANLIVAEQARAEGDADQLLGLFQGRPAADARDARGRNVVAGGAVNLLRARALERRSLTASALNDRGRP